MSRTLTITLQVVVRGNGFDIRNIVSRDDFTPRPLEMLSGSMQNFILQIIDAWVQANYR